MDIFELAELIVKELNCKDIQKAARILRNHQQPVREWFETGDDKLNQNLCSLVALESSKHF